MRHGSIFIELLLNYLILHQPLIIRFIKIQYNGPIKNILFYIIFRFLIDNVEVCLIIHNYHVL